MVYPWVGIVVVITLWQGRPARCGGIEPPRICLFPVFDEFCEEGWVVISAGFISVSEHAEGGVIAVGFEDAFAFGVDKAVEVVSVADAEAVPVGPRAAFDLEGKAGFVGGDKGCLGRAPGMETEVIEAVTFSDVDYAQPFVRSYRRVSG